MPLFTLNAVTEKVFWKSETRITNGKCFIRTKIALTFKDFKVSANQTQ